MSEEQIIARGIKKIAIDLPSLADRGTEILDCKVSDSKLFIRLLDSQTALVFGRCEVIICYKTGETEDCYCVSTQDHEICEKLPMFWDHSWLSENGQSFKESEVQFQFAQPPDNYLRNAALMRGKGTRIEGKLIAQLISGS